MQCEKSLSLLPRSHGREVRAVNGLSWGHGHEFLTWQNKGFWFLLSDGQVVLKYNPPSCLRLHRSLPCWAGPCPSYPSLNLGSAGPRAATGPFYLPNNQKFSLELANLAKIIFGPGPSQISKSSRPWTISQWGRARVHVLSFRSMGSIQVQMFGWIAEEVGLDPGPKTSGNLV